MTPTAWLWLAVGTILGVALSVLYVMLQGLGGYGYLAILAAGLVFGLLVAWNLMPSFEREEPPHPAVPGQINHRRHLRVLAWRKMTVTVIPAGGQKQSTTLVNISVGGVALDWKFGPVPVTSLVHVTAEGYGPAECTVVACSGGVLRLAYTKAVSSRDRRRMRNDCMKGKWVGAPEPPKTAGKK